MAKDLQLNGLIHSKYDSETAMANAMGWSKQKLNRITTGKKVPDLFEVNDIASVLDTSFMSVAQIFLGEKSSFVDEEIDPLHYRGY